MNNFFGGVTGYQKLNQSVFWLCKYLHLEPIVFARDTVCRQSKSGIPTTQVIRTRCDTLKNEKKTVKFEKVFA